MSRNGSGVYSLPAGNPVVSGTTISSTTHNTTMSDVATALTQSLAKDGQTVPTADLPMGSFKHTGVANATARNQYATVDQAQDGEYWAVGSVSGTNTIAGSLSPSITAYVARMFVVLIPANTNTGATTLNLNGVGALDVLTSDGSACAGGELVAGVPAFLVLDSGGDDWIITNPQVGRSRGLEVGRRENIPELKTGSYTFVDADRQTAKIYSGTGGHTFTIPALGLGATYLIYNGGSASLSVAAGTGITTVAWFNGSGTVGTGTRTLAVAGSMSVLEILDGANKNLFVTGVGIT